MPASARGSTTWRSATRPRSDLRPGQVRRLEVLRRGRHPPDRGRQRHGDRGSRSWPTPRSTDYKTDILPREQSVIDLVRVACYIHQIPLALDMVKDAHDKGYETTLNLMSVSVVQEYELMRRSNSSPSEAEGDLPGRQLRPPLRGAGALPDEHVPRPRQARATRSGSTPTTTCNSPSPTRLRPSSREPTGWMPPSPGSAAGRATARWNC